MMSREFLTLWGGSRRVDLNRKVNSHVDHVWSNQWHHCAYAYNSQTNPRPLVQFFLDGKQLDMGSVLPLNTKPIGSQIIPNSYNKWESSLLLGAVSKDGTESKSLSSSSSPSTSSELLSSSSSSSPSASSSSSSVVFPVVSVSSPP